MKLDDLIFEMHKYIRWNGPGREVDFRSIVEDRKLNRELDAVANDLKGRRRRDQLAAGRKLHRAAASEDKFIGELWKSMAQLLKKKNKTPENWLAGVEMTRTQDALQAAEKSRSVFHYIKFALKSRGVQMAVGGLIIWGVVSQLLSKPDATTQAKQRSAVN